MDSSRVLTLLLVGQPLLKRTLSLQMHEALGQSVSTYYHLEGLTREELDAYQAQQLKAASVSQPLFDDTARQGMYQATKGIPRKSTNYHDGVAAGRGRGAAVKPTCYRSSSYLPSNLPPRRRNGSSRDCCPHAAFCSWAVIPRWARACWWPIWDWRWPRARSAPASHPHRAPRSDLSVRAAHATVYRTTGDDAPRRGCGRRSEPASGHPRRRICSAHRQGLNRFLNAAREAAPEVIVLDPVYSTHDQDESDTRSMAALCQSL